MMNTTLVYGITAVWKLGGGAMILIGVALNYLFGSANSMIQYLASEDQLTQIVHWSFGSMTGITWSQILIMAVFTALAMPYFIKSAWPYNIMCSSGEESARALGIDTRRIRIISGVLVAVGASCIISFVGVIGFVGMVAPHIARLICGGDYRTLLPMSALLGAALVFISDTIGRTIASPTIIPVGIILSVIGAPIFVYLILTRNKAGVV
jgi:iron complex transport system permease protein